MRIRADLTQNGSLIKILPFSEFSLENLQIFSTVPEPFLFRLTGFMLHSVPHDKSQDAVVLGGYDPAHAGPRAFGAPGLVLTHTDLGSLKNIKWLREGSPVRKLTN